MPQMPQIGFSTGALAYGDFRRGVALQTRLGIDAIELSALRESELDELVNALGGLDLSQFAYRSFHAPSELHCLSGGQLAAKLAPVAAAGFPIVVHPDVIRGDFAPWRQLGDKVLLENMDTRKSVCRTAKEMIVFFDELPKARLCFDIGHAHQVDSTMTVAFEFIHLFRSRLAQVHISEVNWECQHRRIGTASALSFHAAARWIPNNVPVIIESVVSEGEIDQELQTVRRCFDTATSYFSGRRRHAVPAG